MTGIVVVFFLVLASLSAVAACTAVSARRVLWGQLLATIAIGIAVEIAIKGYLGVLVLSVFLVTDVVVYLFLRTQTLVPKEPVQSAKTDTVYRSTMFWVILCACAAGAYAFFSTEFEPFSTYDSSLRLAALYDKLWGSDWLLVVALLFSLAAFVAGGFLLVRKGGE